MGRGASEGVGGIRKLYLGDGTLRAGDEQHVSTRYGFVAMRGDVPAAAITRPLLGQISDDQFRCYLSPFHSEWNCSRKFSIYLWRSSAIRRPDSVFMRSFSSNSFSWK